jgi:hypothetical protein
MSSADGVPKRSISLLSSGLMRLKADRTSPVVADAPSDAASKNMSVDSFIMAAPLYMDKYIE